MSLSSNRRSPPSEVRPQLAPITGMYPAMNVMLSGKLNDSLFGLFAFYLLTKHHSHHIAPRHIAPRPQNPNYKGNKPR